MADSYGTIKRRLSIDGRVFQVGVNVGGSSKCTLFDRKAVTKVTCK